MMYKLAINAVLCAGVFVGAYVAGLIIDKVESPQETQS